MTDDVHSPGLRERKRLATRRAIQVAVLQLVRDHGYDNVTVEMISRTADISPRTFFNYFPSKEDAVVGDPPRMPDDLDDDAFITGGPTGMIFSDIVPLLDRAMEANITDPELVLSRRQVLRTHPELFARRSASMHEFESELLAVLTRRLLHDEPHLADDPDTLTRRASLLSLVTMAALRHAWGEWLDHHTSDTDVEGSLRRHLERSFADLSHVMSNDVPQIR